jgi:hypothetical protein
VISPLLANDSLAKLDCVVDAEGVRGVRDRSVRGWGAYWKRAPAAGIFARLESWITRRLRAYLAKRWRTQLWRRYPDPFCWEHLRLTRLDALRRDFLRPLGVRPRAGNRLVERSAGKPHATFVRGTEPSLCPFRRRLLLPATTGMLPNTQHQRRRAAPSAACCCSAAACLAASYSTQSSPS